MSIHGNWLCFTSSTGALGGSFLSGTVRAKPRLYYDHFNRNASFFKGPGQFQTGWYRLLSEPVRRKPPLPQAAIPYLFGNIPNLSYSFTLTEIGDSVSITMAPHPPQNRARVGITEVATATAQVTIREINYNRGYS